MATTRKTTGKRSAKPTATTRARAAKTTTKTTKKTTKPAARKSTKVTVLSVKSSAQKDVKKSAQTRSTFEKLRDWNIAAAMLQVAQSVAVVLLANDRTFPVTTSYTTTDALASLDGDRVLAPASTNLIDIKVAYLLAGVLGVSALVHILLATWKRRQYEAGITARYNRNRWMGTSVVLGLVITVAAMATGFNDKAVLGLLLVSTIVMGLSYKISDKQNQGAGRDWSSFAVGTLSGLVAWVVLGWYVFASSRYGEVTLPSYVLVLLGSMFVLFGAVTYLQYLSIKRSGRWADYVNVERAYLLISIIMTAALTWQIFAGLLR